jgi:hypothetical protein
MQEPRANKIDAVTREAKSGGGKGATTMTSRMDWYNIFILLLSTVAISVIIALYVVSLASFNLKDTRSDPLERAALSAAADLLKLNVFSSDFGSLGIADYVNNDNNLIDSQDGATREVRSFNTVASLIRTSLFVAKRYQLAPMAEQASSDLKELKSLEDELHKRFLAAIKDDGTGKIYEHVKRILNSSTRGGEHLDSLQLKLGIAKNKLAMSAIQAEPEDDPKYCMSGRLKALTPVMVPLSSSPWILHQQSRETTILNSSDFVQDSEPEVPHMPATLSPIPVVILLEAQFATNSARRGLVTSKRKICVVAGADIKNQPYATAPLEGCMAISFPHGKPKAFSSLESVLLYKGWQGKGEWQQAVQGSVPGLGQLAPSAAPVLKDMNGSESLSIALYHWLRQLYSPIAPARMAALLKAPWSRPPIPREADKALLSAGENDSNREDPLEEERAESQQVNSGLLKSSDARVFALLYQNKPSEAGQKALVHCFQARPNKFPPSSLPIVVDSEGQANLPGHQGFDQALAFDLLTSIYSTNLAAQDSLAAAKLIQSSSLRAYHSSKERLFLAQTDLDSLTKRLRSVSDGKMEEALSKEIDWRNNRIAYEVNEQRKQQKAFSLAQLAIANATTVAAQSFECGSKLHQLTRAGINRLDHFKAGNRAGGGVKSGYLLGKRSIFLPITESLKESDIFDEAAKAFEAGKPDSESTSPEPNASATEKQESPWLAKKFSIFGTVQQLTDLPETKLMVEGRSLADLKAEAPPVLKAEPAVIVFTPRLLDRGADRERGPLYFQDYPFKGLAIPESQLVYYCQNAYRSTLHKTNQDESTAAGSTTAGSTTAGSTTAGSTTAGSTTGGNTSKVAWSILARDFVVNRGINSSHQRLGLPLTPAMTGWCKRALNISSQTQNSTNGADEICPGLAAEWQLRSPVMFLNDSESGILKGTILSDPASGQHVPQIPPVSPDLM